MPLSPQHLTPPALVSAQVWSPPAEIAATPPARPETSTGRWRSVVVPSPSCPQPLSPQHLIPPALVSAHEYPPLRSPPAEIAVTPPASPETATGAWQARRRRGDSALDVLRGDSGLLERELGELVPVALDLLRHRLLVGAVLAGHLGGLFVAGLLGHSLEQLVARDLEVLGCIAVARVPPGLLLAHLVDNALHQRA